MRVSNPIEFLALIGETVRSKDDQDRYYRRLFSLIIGGIATVVLVWSFFY